MKTNMAMMAAVICCIGTASTASATILNNGSFETGDFTGWIHNGNISVNSSGEFAVPSDGLYKAVFNGGNRTPNGELSQSFNAAIGETYLLEFDFAKGGDETGLASLEIKVEGAGLLLHESVSDSIGGRPGIYTNYEYSFTADSTSPVLSFTDTTSGTYGFDAVLDNVSIIAIPEPSSIAMIGMVCGCAVLVRRRFMI